MYPKIVSISYAKTKLLEMTRKINDEGMTYLITKDGKPVSALVSFEDFEAFFETADIMTNPTLLKNLRIALDDVKNNRLWKRDSKGKWIKLTK